MSAIGGKADVLPDRSACPLIATSGHSHPFVLPFDWRTMARIKSIAAAILLIGCLPITGCTSETYAKRTDLSVLEPGASRDQVESVLGDRR